MNYGGTNPKGANMKAPRGHDALLEAFYLLVFNKYGDLEGELTKQ